MNDKPKGRCEMAYVLPNDHAVQLKVSYYDAKGNPAQVDGDVDWASSDETIARITVDGTDSTRCMVYPVDNLGQAQISATADADLGEGVTEIITTGNIEVVAGQAVSGTIEPVGDPIPLPVGK